VDAAELARKLRVPLARAEELLALAQVEKFLTEPMEAVPEYSAPGAKVRVDPGSAATDLDDPLDEHHVERGRRTR
jgi:hypothetical protein